MMQKGLGREGKEERTKKMNYGKIEQWKMIERKLTDKLVSAGNIDDHHSLHT